MIHRQEEAFFEQWSPGAQARAEQQQAAAVDGLRTADSYFLVTATSRDGVTADFRVIGGGTALTGVHQMVLRMAAREAVRMLLSSREYEEGDFDEAA